jgi:hypothetical protein
LSVGAFEECIPAHLVFLEKQVIFSFYTFHFSRNLISFILYIFNIDDHCSHLITFVAGMGRHKLTIYTYFQEHCTNETVTVVKWWRILYNLIQHLGEFGIQLYLYTQP